MFAKTYLELPILQIRIRFVVSTTNDIAREAERLLSCMYILCVISCCTDWFGVTVYRRTGVGMATSFNLIFVFRPNVAIF